MVQSRESGSISIFKFRKVENETEMRAIGLVDKMKVRNLVKRLQQDGRVVVRTRGSHRQFRHLSKPGTTTVSGHPSDEIHPKTLKSILRQAGLEETKS